MKESMTNKIEQAANALASCWSGIWDQRTERGELIVSKEVEQAIDELYRAVQESHRKRDRKGAGGRKKLEFDLKGAQALLERGKSKTEVAKMFRVSRRTLNDRMKEVL